MTLDAALAESESTIVGLAFRLAHRPAERDDLAQVGRLAAWLAWETFDGTGRVVGWMCGKAKWAMIDHLRSQGPFGKTGVSRAALSLDGDVASLAETLADPSPGPERVVIARAEAVDAVAWLASLPARTADAVVLPVAEWSQRWDRHPSRASQIRTETLAARAA